MPIDWSPIESVVLALHTLRLSVTLASIIHPSLTAVHCSIIEFADLTLADRLLLGSKDKPNPWCLDN